MGHEVECVNGCGNFTQTYCEIVNSEPVYKPAVCIGCPGSFKSGAAVAFGLMGMAMTINKNEYHKKWSEYWEEANIDSYDT